ncbi:LOW QUALITY PROTEIN: KRAB-A domain-containing protein 2-like [Leptinotarsa decemlineata]|uniref:LOW QUALITY PROTEIN: KRAB-A domain-containing protein 2-like n=1 Tax=Leptinotarsa decemlineata TaxID=7539 RepID=UPI003D304FB0
MGDYEQEMARLQSLWDEIGSDDEINDSSDDETSYNVSIVSDYPDFEQEADVIVEIEKDNEDNYENNLFQDSSVRVQDDYKKLVLEVEDAKAKPRKEPRHYWLLNRYDVMIVENVQKLIHPLKQGDGVVKFYVHDSDLFTVLHEAHVAIGHGGRDRMLKELDIKYKNVTRHDVELYISLCEPCQKKQKGSKRGVSQPDREFKFIIVYQDHLTKFVILKPLKTKTAEEVAYHLVVIFTLIGAPSILQSDNGREFANKIVYNLKDYWPTLKIVHGKPRHSQSQGSVERANQDIENMISTWMQDEKTDRWSEGLRFVQLMKNRAKVKVGLTTSSLPRDILDSINSEEDLERVVNNMHTTETQTMSSLEPPLQTDHNTSEVNEATVDVSVSSSLLQTCSVCLQQTNEKQNCTKCLADIHISCGHSIQGCDDTEKTLLCVPCFNSENIDKERKRSKACLEKQAKKMKANSDKKFPPVTKGVTVRVPIPDVDKGRGDLRWVLQIRDRQRSFETTVRKVTVYSLQKKPSSSRRRA